MSIPVGRQWAHLPGLLAALEALATHLERDSHSQVQLRSRAWLCSFICVLLAAVLVPHLQAKFCFSKLGSDCVINATKPCQWLQLPDGDLGPLPCDVSCRPAALWSPSSASAPHQTISRGMCSAAGRLLMVLAKQHVEECGLKHRVLHDSEHTEIMPRNSEDFWGAS